MRRAIAIDFDGTICTNAYPNIGEPKWALINEALKQQKQGEPPLHHSDPDGRLHDAVLPAYQWSDHSHWAVDRC